MMAYGQKLDRVFFFPYNGYAFLNHILREKTEQKTFSFLFYLTTKQKSKPPLRV